jgi:hypothetical protein
VTALLHVAPRWSAAAFRRTSSSSYRFAVGPSLRGPRSIDAGPRGTAVCADKKPCRLSFTAARVLLPDHRGGDTTLRPSLASISSLLEDSLEGAAGMRVDEQRRAQMLDGFPLPVHIFSCHGSPRTRTWTPNSGRCYTLIPDTETRISCGGCIMGLRLVGLSTCGRSLGCSRCRSLPWHAFLAVTCTNHSSMVAA